MSSSQSGSHAPSNEIMDSKHDAKRSRHATERDMRVSLAPYAPIWSSEIEPPTQAAAPIYHPAFERILKRLPEEHLRALTQQQLIALSLASLPSVAPHILDYRVSLPFFGRRYYLSFLAGREKRSRARLVADGQLPAGQLLRLNPIAWSLLLSLLVFGTMTTLYIVKSMFGIDVFEDNLAMQDLMRFLNDPAHNLSKN